MVSEVLGGGKLPGKTLYAGRRRAATRTSGFKVHEETTGGEFLRHSEDVIALQQGESVTVAFNILGHSAGDMIGYGVWFWCTDNVDVKLKGGFSKKTLKKFGQESWGKAGSMWRAVDSSPVRVEISFYATSLGDLALYSPMCGRIRHRHMDNARAELMSNMYQFAPEALFIRDSDAGEVAVTVGGRNSGRTQEIILKSCNRCGRYLPINIEIERNQLSFANHCVANHLLPCKHSTFSRLKEASNHENPHGNCFIRLDHGYQLECRFCKKFEVNAPHNPQRTSAQMKEDGARRRAFELLLAELYGGTPQLRYRKEKGGELANDVWERFGRACFKCGICLPSPRSMHLDHTRPLALLWPLDETATALCAACNSEKRDRAPSQFYSSDKLLELSEIVGLPYAELVKDSPNEEAIDILLNRMDWFFEEFLTRPDMVKEREGKVAGELVIKALQKALARSRRKDIDLQYEYERRRAD